MLIFSSPSATPSPTVKCIARIVIKKVTSELLLLSILI